MQSIIMFAMGGCGCIIESLRFGQLHKAQISPDITYNAGVIVMYLFLQAILGMLCCCAPAVKTIAVRISDTTFKCTINLRSHSNDIFEPGDVAQDIGNNENSMHDRGGAQTSPFDEVTIESVELGYLQDNTEIDLQRSGSSAASDYHSNINIVAVQRIIELEEILKLDDNKSPAL
ncbi:hypothetical protein H072_4297 [Dactylellina haptotyla CBS 200.50]|uniref:Rhodopsin domain-containing protein n=1 Tax=Dactylellina haptotyla (strain CBS 200.50) TaxID=1284197 RepID=S8AG19_DACHA|nr:hypothetical protein H072_4297 [Dactylellina haptotyla CBS 200.50]